ncbi:hypothetical protein LSUE1_G001515 [Lachnellula suecica]|uniref:Reverse transcriptase domain-containing protein n=1 Tax=Lachnellula suecica TaxID=602035 RepID=A0A8T9CHH3_9HELO|nr:hypothetical protein LSUE1_G001515 [Lachnellula suecica]
MASHHILPGILASMSEAKFKEVLNQKTTFEAEKLSLLQAVRNEPSPRLKVKILLDRIENVPSMSKIAKKPRLNLDHIRHFIDQAEHDPSVSTTLMREWQSTLERELYTQSERYKFSELYCRLTNEWVSVSKKEDVDVADGFTLIDLSREEMHEERKAWEEYVFTAKITDTRAIQAYLKKTFATSDPQSEVQAAHKSLCNSTRKFEEEWDADVHFDSESFPWVIAGLLRSDLLTDEKRKALKDFSKDEEFLPAYGRHLNVRMSNLENWQWGASKEGIPINFRRGLNDKYRSFQDEELHEAIMLQYIGVKWAVHFQKQFTEFRAAPGVWKSSISPIPEEDQQRFEYFTGQRLCQHKDSVDVFRVEQFREEFFVEQLPKKHDEVRSYNSVHTSQTILRTVTSDMIMKTALGQDQIIVRSDFKQFGPTLPHSTIFAVLEFFGVSAKWIKFFQRVLEAPIKVEGGDAVRTRKRGTPPSSPLSDVLAESIFFCLDFAFNRDTNGALLYRMHDDIWTWGDEKTCIAGWASITKFAALMGLVLNNQKTGSCKITGKGSGSNNSGAIHPGLPNGDVRWGLFLKLDAKSGRFLIDQAVVDKHISELGFQLNACKSIFDWIQIWNIYAVRFFTIHFGRSANCLGLAHIDMVIKTFERIQKTLFGSVGGNVTSALKRKIEEKSGIANIPDGFMHYPTSYGGLDAKNPFTTPYLLRKSLPNTPEAVMDEFLAQEMASYESAKSAFNTGPLPCHSVLPQEMNDQLRGQPFMSFEKFTRHRGGTSNELLTAYKTLLSEAKEEEPPRAINRVYLPQTLWKELTNYERSITQLHYKNMLNRFDQLFIAEEGILPTETVDKLRESRFKLED